MSVSSVVSKPDVVPSPRTSSASPRPPDDRPDRAADGFGALLDGSDAGPSPVRPEQPKPPAAAAEEPEKPTPVARDPSKPLLFDGKADAAADAGAAAEAAMPVPTINVPVLVTEDPATATKGVALKQKGAPGDDAQGDAAPDATTTDTAAPADAASVNGDIVVPVLASPVPIALVASAATPAAAQELAATTGISPGAEASTPAGASVGIDPAAAQLLANAPIGGPDRPNARSAPAKPADALPRAQAGVAGEAANAPTASASPDALVAAGRADAASPHATDAGDRKAAHGESGDGAATKAPADTASTMRADTASPIAAGSASVALAAHNADAAQSAAPAAPSATAPITGATSATPTKGSSAVAAHASAAYAAAVPISGLAVEIAARAREGKNRFEIRLDPPDLGRIDVQLDVDRQGHVTSRLVVERSETLDLLKRDAPSLERALQSAGLKTDGGLEFSLRDQSLARDRSAPSAPVNAPMPEDDSAPVAVAQRSYWRLRGAGSGVDISV